MSDPPAHRRGIDSVEHLAEHLREVLAPRSVIVCVGSELSGDDAVGPIVARQVSGKVPWPVLDCQTVPESFVMKIAGLKPEVVLVVDALHFDAPAGAVEIFAAENIAGQGPSTHGPAPIAFLDVLNMFHPCRRVVLGVQPERSGFGQEVSPPVQKAIEMVCEALRRAGTAQPQGGRP